MYSGLMHTQSRPRRSRQLRSKRLRSMVRLIDRAGVDAVPPYVGPSVTLVAQLAQDRTPTKTDLETARAKLTDVPDAGRKALTLMCEDALARAYKRTEQTHTARAVHLKDSKGRYREVRVPIPSKLDYPHRLRLLAAERELQHVEPLSKEEQERFRAKFLSWGEGEGLK